jgi:hypothetical protein
MLDSTILEKNISDKVVYFFWALELPKTTSYDTELVGGSNLRVPYRLNMGPVLTAPELRARATSNGRTLEEESYEIMLDLVPEAYKPKDRQGQIYP